jgi:hypothetical protein
MQKHLALSTVMGFFEDRSIDMGFGGGTRGIIAGTGHSGSSDTSPRGAASFQAGVLLG